MSKALLPALKPLFFSRFVVRSEPKNKNEKKILLKTSNAKNSFQLQISALLCKLLILDSIIEAGPFFCPEN